MAKDMTAVVLAVGLVAMLIIMGVMLIMPQPPVEGDGGGDVIVQTAETVATTIDYFNLLNDASAEGLDVTTVCVGNGVFVFTDTTSPTAQDFVKNAAYTCSPVSAADADQGKVISERTGTSPDIDLAIASDGGSFTFTPKLGQASVVLNAHEQGSFRVKVYQGGTVTATNLCSANLNSSVGCDVWNSTDGVTYGSATDGSTALAVANGESLELVYEIRATATDENVNDRGVFVLVDKTTAFDDAGVTVDGVAWEEIDANLLTPDEADAYTTYEQIYFIPQDKIVESGRSVVVALEFEADSEPGAGDDVSIDLHPRATFRSTTDNNIVLVGSVTDAATPADIHTRFDTAIDIS
jgi:hypothetical protein